MAELITQKNFRGAINTASLAAIMTRCKLCGLFMDVTVAVIVDLHLCISIQLFIIISLNLL
jgi:hypothetical protein